MDQVPIIQHAFYFFIKSDLTFANYHYLSPQFLLSNFITFHFLEPLLRPPQKLAITFMTRKNPYKK